MLEEEQLTERKNEQRKNKQEARFEDILYYIMGIAAFRHKRNHRTPQLVSSNSQCLPQHCLLPVKGWVSPPVPVTPQPQTAPQVLETCGANHPARQEQGLSKGCSLSQQREGLGIGFLRCWELLSRAPSSWITEQPLGHATCMHLYLMMRSLEQKSCSSFKCYCFTTCQRTLFLVIALHLTQ